MNKEKPNYYAIIPAEVRYDDNLSANEKLLYGEISALSNEYGYCFATNGYFAKLYYVSNETVSRWISSLRAHNYVDVKLIKEGNQVKQRKITLLTKTSIPSPQKDQYPIDENVKDNNTSINITSNNIPTVDEVEDYFAKKEDKNNYVQFVDLWNETYGTKLRITDGKRTQIKARLESFTEDEIKLAIANRSKDSFLNGEGKKYLTSWNSFWRNDEKVERYLNKEQPKKTNYIAI